MTDEEFIILFLLMEKAAEVMKQVGPTRDPLCEASERLGIETFWQSMYYELHSRWE